MIWSGVAAKDGEAAKDGFFWPRKGANISMRMKRRVALISAMEDFLAKRPFALFRG
ncbi:hypothetical protein OPIT5_08960 [Opitutaceae bacterium TAV5]|nr:hypothetical protein OPIT5_08960 [Opitutaceae bacterium TAV5]